MRLRRRLGTAIGERPDGLAGSTPRRPADGYPRGVVDVLSQVAIRCTWVGRCQATFGHRLSRDGQAGVLPSSTASAAVTLDVGVGAGATLRGSGTTSRRPSLPGLPEQPPPALQASPGVTPVPTGQATPVPPKVQVPDVNFD